MGGSKKVTVGYWYKMLLHFVVGRGPIDALLEIRGGDRIAWGGVMSSSGTISIDSPSLWGGESGEGGIVTDVDVMLGEEDQQPNEYLRANLGPMQPAYRGRASVLFKGGKYGAMNPYPKPASFKLRRIVKGWPQGTAWYPEKAEIVMFAGVDPVQEQLGPTSGGWRYAVRDNDRVLNWGLPRDSPSLPFGAMPFASGTGHPYVGAAGFPDKVGTAWPINNFFYAKKSFDLTTPRAIDMVCFVDNFVTVYINGKRILNHAGGNTGASPEEFLQRFTIPASLTVSGKNWISLICEDTGIRSYAALSMQVVGDLNLTAMNPAHILYYSLTSNTMGNEPVQDIDEDSFTNAADRLFEEGFGLCTSWDPTKEAVEQFQQRICDVIGARLNKSIADGKWYLDLIRGDYVLGDLPVLTDDDILEFSEQPSIQDNAINQLSVVWFDPERKEDRTTSPIQSLSAINSFGGVIADTRDYPEIPVEPLAMRVCDRDLRNSITPLRRFDLVTTRVLYRVRSGQYFRLQAPKRGYADMVCMMGEKDSGELRSGAMKISVVENIFSMPDTVYLTPQEPVDTGQDDAPVVLEEQAAFEVPYRELVQYLPAADLAALQPDAGFIASVGMQPNTARGYELFTGPLEGVLEDRGQADFTPTAVIAEALGVTQTVVDIVGGRSLDEVQIGTTALIGAEIVRVDAIDLAANTITLARGCVDTVPAGLHDAGTRIWFYDIEAYPDPTEWSDGETVDVRLLTRTGSGQLGIDFATPILVTLDGRQARPYPPGNLQINGIAYPDMVFEAVDVTWSHRDRIAQADQVVDTLAGNIGPEPGVTYTVRWYIDTVLVNESTGITDTAASFAPAADGQLTVEVWAMRAGTTSWQALSHTAPYSANPASNRVTPTGDYRITPSGDRRITTG